MQTPLSTRDFRFFCPHCSQSLEATVELIGETFECPSCKKAIVVPKPTVHPTPPPIPHQPNHLQLPHMPPVVVIQKKSGCLSSGLIVVGLIFFGVVGLLVLGLIAGSAAIKDGAEKSPSVDSTPREKTLRELKEEIRIRIKLDWAWKKTGFGNIMEADFTITNFSPHDIKDIEISTIQSGKSGTQIDRNARTIYEIIKAGETKQFKNFNMGFIHSQSESASATITDFVIIK